MEVYRLNIWTYNPGKTEGSVQSGIRPGVVVSNDLFNKHSTLVKLIAGTSHIDKKKLPTHFILGEECGLKYKTLFMAEQELLLPKENLIRRIGYVTQEYTYVVNNAIRIQNGIYKPFDEDYVKELIDDIILVDKWEIKGIASEDEYRMRVRRFKEIERYCSDYGFDHEFYLDKYYRKRGAMCG